MSDYSLLYDANHLTHPAWKSFEKHMERCHYGYDALNQAWEFFKAGWELCDKVKTQ